MLRAIRRSTLCLTSAALAACGTGSLAPDDQSPFTFASFNSDAAVAPSQITTTAVVQFVPIEGGCWLLVTASGRRFEPVNLTVAYRVNGMAVTVVLREAPRVHTICQNAPPVRIMSIK